MIVEDKRSSILTRALKGCVSAPEVSADAITMCTEDDFEQNGGNNDDPSTVQTRGHRGVTAIRQWAFA